MTQTIKQIKTHRIKKIKAIQSAGLMPYPPQIRRTCQINLALKNFSLWTKAKKEIILAGRIRSIRFHGSLTFLHFEDESGKIQALFNKAKLGGEKYKFFLDNFDIDDFIEIKGVLSKTKKGEKTIEVSEFKMLAKSLLPLPEKWHGLKDIEERYRKRYLDLMFNPDVKKKFKLRSRIIREIRNFLNKEGFLEVETPVLQPIYGGASARPFRTHLNALNMSLYLRIAPELYLKRLLVGGFEKIYEIGKAFRNEGIDKSHTPEYTHFEMYWAYQDHKGLMKFIEKMLELLVKKIIGKSKIEYEGKKISFKTPFERIEFSQIIKKYTKINLEEISSEALNKEAGKLGVEIKKGEGKAEIADKIYKKFCLSQISKPTFLLHHLKEKSALAKALEKEPKKIASFQLICRNWELGWGYSELNDPIEQRRRFEEQEKFFKKGLKEAQRMDEEFIESLEYGMPPAAGFGMGIDRLVAILTNSRNLREVILFPIMKPK